MCTGIKLTAEDGKIFFGRTMDLNAAMFGEDPGLNGDVRVVAFPKNYEIASQLDNWVSKYSVLGIGTNNTTILYDGINECGLVGDTQVLIEATRCEKDKILESGNIPVLAKEFVTYILTNFSSVAEIRKAYSNYTLVDQAYNFNGIELQYPLHYSFVDESGDGVVLEPVLNGQFKLYDYIGVMTNSPEYDYHKTNIRNYIGLENINVAKKNYKNDVTLNPIENGTGFGLLGMPGDYTSPSRFIRSFYFSNMIDSFNSAKGLTTLYAIFRPFIIPRGIGKQKETDTISDYTRYWSGYDLSNRTLVVQSAEGLCFTAKSLDATGENLTYEDINLDNNFYYI